MIDLVYKLLFKVHYKANFTLKTTNKVKIECNLNQNSSIINDHLKYIFEYECIKIEISIILTKKIINNQFK